MNRGRPKSFNDSEALERAMKVFWKSGYDATSLDDLLNAMAIPRQSLYRTFGDKRALFIKALELYGGKISDAISNIRHSSAPAMEKIDALFALWSNGVLSADGNGCLIQNTSGQSVMKEKEVVTLLVAHQQRLAEALQEFIDQGKSQGSVAPDTDTLAVSRTVLSSINGLFGLSRIGLQADFSDDVFATLRSLIQAK